MAEPQVNPQSSEAAAAGTVEVDNEVGIIETQNAGKSGPFALLSTTRA